MPAPFSNDLRSRIIAAYEAGQTKVSVLAKRFDVSTDTVGRYLARYLKTGSVAPDPHGGGRHPVIGLEQVDKLAAVIAQKPDATIEELCATYKKMHGKVVTWSAMQRALDRFGVTSKKKSLIAFEQTRPDVVKRREEFARLQQEVPAAKLVFLDETGVNKSMTKREAWAPMGCRAVDCVPGNKGKNVTLIGAVRQSGIIAMQTLEDSLTGESFLYFIKNVLCPKLKPGDWVVFDNCSSHKNKRAQEALESVGAVVKFLPPYSPDLNPIEMVWNALKRRFERIEVSNVAEIRAALRKAWRSLSNLGFTDLFAGCGYALPQPL